MVENHRVLRLDTVRFTQLLDTVPDWKKNAFYLCEWMYYYLDVKPDFDVLKLDELTGQSMSFMLAS